MFRNNCSFALKTIFFLIDFFPTHQQTEPTGKEDVSLPDVPEDKIGGKYMENALTWFTLVD